MQMHLATDRSRQKCLRATIFGVAHDRVTNGRHVRAQLVRSPGQRLKLEPGGAITRHINRPVERPRDLPLFLVDLHLLAACPWLLGQRRVDHAVLGRGNSDDQRPIDLARGAA